MTAPRPPAGAPPPCEKPGEPLASFVACLDEQYDAELPKRDDLQQGLPAWVLYGYPVDRFEDVPGYLYLARIDRPWALSVGASPISADAVTVLVAETASPGLHELLAARRRRADPVNHVEERRRSCPS